MNILIKHRKVISLFLIITGITFGILMFYKLSNNNINYLIESASNFKYLSTKDMFMHIIILSLSALFSVILIGIVIIMIYLFFECVIIGFISSYLITLYKLKGILYMIIYIGMYKALNMFLTIILIMKYIQLIKHIINYFKGKTTNITKYILNIVIINFIIISNDLFLLFFGQKLINIFSFLIK